VGAKHSACHPHQSRSKGFRLNIKTLVRSHLETSAQTKHSLLEQFGEEIEQIARDTAACLLSGGKVITCGNGGSASDSEHIAAEFVGRYRRERPSLPSVALTVPGALITAIGNDYGYEQVFSRQVEGQGKKGDILFCFSTSGNSPSVIAAARAARRLGIKTVGFTGATGGKLVAEVDSCIRVPSSVTAHIQECHITVGHIICEISDELLSLATPAAQLTKLQTLDSLLSLREQWRRAGKTVVWSNGCFDLLHNGHVRNLQEAKTLGDILIVGVNSDNSVKSNKGPKRPIQDAESRSEMIAALGCVDFVMIFDDKNPAHVLSLLQPDIHCKGADYEDGSKPMEERATVEAYGGQIRFLKLHPGFSTTSLIERIQSEVASN